MSSACNECTISETTDAQKSLSLESRAEAMHRGSTHFPRLEDVVKDAGIRWSRVQILVPPLSSRKGLGKLDSG